MPTLTYRPQIFVFGSNAQGIHGAGSAKYAAMFHGAIRGQGSGFQGKKNHFGHMVPECYGIITCKRPCHGPEDWITLVELKAEIDKFVADAKANSDKDFKVTQVACGFAGHTKEEVAPLFIDAPENCFFDTAWKPFLGETKGYWGTFPADSCKSQARAARQLGRGIRPRNRVMPESGIPDLKSGRINNHKSYPRLTPKSVEPFFVLNCPKSGNRSWALENFREIGSHVEKTL